MRAKTATIAASMSRSWTPSSLSNLVIWLKSDTGLTLSGSNVTQWDDQSGNGNHFTQSTAANKPTYTANQINGLPTIYFDGVNDSMATAAITLNQPETIFIVFNTPTFPGAGSRGLFDGKTGDKGALYTNVDPNFFAYAGASLVTTGAEAVGDYQLGTIIFNGASSKVEFNNNGEATGNAGSQNMGGMTLASYASGSGYEAECNIAEVIVLSAAASTTDRDNVKAYVTSRYGITM